MWQIIFILVIASLIAGFVWMAFAVCRFDGLRHHLPSKRWKRMLVGMGVVALVMLSLCLTMDFINMVVCFLHLLFIWLMCDGVGLVVEKLRKRPFRHYYQGYLALLMTLVWLGVGWRNAHHVVRTTYDLTTSKRVPNLRIVGFSDSHVGATFHWQEFETYVERMNAERPDVVVIMGDFVDDDTSKEDMEMCCKALGRLKTKYGVFFVYGNHDEGYWENNGRGYTLANLDRCLEASGVTILRDETMPITGDVGICGRLDKSRSQDRKSANELMKGRKGEEFVIVLDHEPNDYDDEAASGMDLVVSGHTHGGQFLGLGEMGLLLGANDALYGYEKRKDTDFVVSSGIGDWAIKFKTGCIAEYIVINLKSEK